MKLTKCTCAYRSQNICDGCFIANKLRNFMGKIVLPALVVASVVGLFIIQ